MSDALERGRKSFGRQAWSDAYALLSEADRDASIGIEDLERLATAAHLVGRDDESADVWARAHHACLGLGDVPRAVRCVYWLCFGLFNRSEVARAGGWLARARRLVDEGQCDCLENDEVVQFFESYVASFEPPVREGVVVVVGSGSSGGQIAADLARSGRQVYLALGRCTWLPRRYRGRDITGWNEATGFSALPAQSLDDPRARLKCLPMLTGTDAGEDMTPRTLRDEGIVLSGRLVGVDNHKLRFADDLAATLAAGDGFVSMIEARVDAYIEAKGLDAPPSKPDVLSAPDPMDSSLRELDLEAAGVSAVVWATGYRLDFGWIRDAHFDEQGFPVHEGGITREPGLYFVGLPWLNTRGSSFIIGVGADAEKIVGHLATLGAPQPTTPRGRDQPLTEPLLRPLMM